MPASVHIQKNRLGRMVIEDVHSQAAWDELPVGRTMRADIVVPRNRKRSNQFFALLRIVYDAQDYFETFENMRSQVLIGCGFFVMNKRFDGSQYPVADSMRFDKMDDVQFNGFFDAFVRMCDKRILPGVGEQAIRDLFEEVLAGNSGKLGTRNPQNTKAA